MPPKPVLAVATTPPKPLPPVVSVPNALATPGPLNARASFAIGQSRCACPCSSQTAHHLAVLRHVHVLRAREGVQRGEPGGASAWASPSGGSRARRPASSSWRRASDVIDPGEARTVRLRGFTPCDAKLKCLAVRRLHTSLNETHLQARSHTAASPTNPSYVVESAGADQSRPPISMPNEHVGRVGEMLYIIDATECLNVAHEAHEHAPQRSTHLKTTTIVMMAAMETHLSSVVRGHAALRLAQLGDAVVILREDAVRQQGVMRAYLMRPP